MANFYTDNDFLKFHLENPLMKKIVALKEKNFNTCKDGDLSECDEYAPLNYEDAMDN